MKQSAYLVATLLIAGLAAGQGSLSAQVAPVPTVKSTSRLVIVPTLVRSSSGDLISTLGTGDFQISDNGVQQQILALKEENQPVAIAVVMQTGGAASLQFENYQTLGAFLDRMIDNPADKIALATFDSRVEQVWSYPDRVDGEKLVFKHLEAGDHGAAIVDAVECGIDMLQQQPPNLRRILLLLSQPEDEGSSAPLEEVLRRLGESNITIFSVTFPPEKGPRTEHGKKQSDSRKQRGRGLKPRLSDSSSILEFASQEIRRNAASGFAELSGGEQVQLKGVQGIERTISILENDISNGYTLSFQPTGSEPGFHILRVLTVKNDSRLAVEARMIYWVNGAGTEN